MKAFACHMKALVAETAVAGMAAMTMYGLIVMASSALAIDIRISSLLAAIFVFPYAAIILTMKTVFPRTPGNRAYLTVAYIFISQIIAATFVATLLEVIGECWNCSGNVHDIVFYGLALGTPYGILYALFSQLFSLDVDTLIRGV